jgi:type II secretory pathway pseudopilin PulG
MTKARLVGKGSSTLEILIAFAILTLALTAVILVFSSNQAIAVDTQTSNEALALAEAQLEAARAAARQDFNLVNPLSSSVVNGITYTQTLAVGQTGLFTKQATSTVSWSEGGRTLSVILSTLFTNPSAIHGGDTCSSVLVGNWTDPQISAPIAVEDPGNSASGNPVTDIDVFDHKLYITTDNAHGHNADFYIFDSSVNPGNPTYVNSTSTISVHAGLNAVAVASTTSTRYAYVVSANDPNFKTCKPSQNCSQLQIIDVSNLGAATLSGAYYLVPTSTPPFVLGNMTSSGQAVGKSIFYKDGVVYLGLSKTASGPEFIVLDVGGGGAGGTPLSPVYLGSYPVGRGVNDILVKGGYAYLATDDPSNDLLILNVHTLSNPTFAGHFDASGIGFGEAQYLVGNTLYFGTSYAGDATPEFYFLDDTNPASTLSASASKSIGSLANPQSVNGILVRDYLAFLLTTKYFQVWNISTPSSMSLVKSFDLTSVVGPGSGGFASECEGNYIYLGSYRNNNDKGVLLVVSPGP